MPDLFDGLPVALFESMNIGKPNAAIKLYEGRLKINGENEKSLEGLGFVELSWLPSPRLQFSVCGEEGLGIFHSDLGDKLSVELLEVDVSLEAFWTNRSNHFMSGVITGNAESFSGGDIQHVTFCVPNFAYFIGKPIKYSESSSSAARMSFRAEDWEIIVDGLFDREDIYNTLNSKGGYAITHVGQMK